jgi:O-antigen/teichoic acid export membrane protein
MSFSSSLARDSLRRNSFWLLCARVSTLALALLFVALAARNLTPQDFGQFTLISAIILIGNAFTTFGTDTLLMRNVAKAGQVTAVVTQAFTLQLVLSVLWYFVTLLPGTDANLRLYTLALFPLTVFSVVSALFRAVERMELFWVLSLTNSLLQVLAAWLAFDTFTLCAALLAGHFLSATLGIWLGSISFPAFKLFPLIDFRPILKITLPFAALSILSMILQRLGVVSVSLWLDDVATGIFSAAARIMEGLKLGHYAIFGALLPMVARGAFKSRRAQLKLLGGLIGLSLIIAVVAVIAIHPLIQLLFGERYLEAAHLFTVMVWSLIPYTLSTYIAVELVAYGEEMRLATASALSLSIFVALYFWLIHAFALTGTAYATLIGEIIQTLIFVGFHHKSKATHRADENLQ